MYPYAATYLGSRSPRSHQEEGSSLHHGHHGRRPRAAQSCPDYKTDTRFRLTSALGATMRSILPPRQLFSHLQPLIFNPATKCRILPQMRCATTEERKNMCRLIHITSPECRIRNAWLTSCGSQLTVTRRRGEAHNSTYPQTSRIIGKYKAGLHRFAVEDHPHSIFLRQRIKCRDQLWAAVWISFGSSVNYVVEYIDRFCREDKPVSYSNGLFEEVYFVICQRGITGFADEWFFTGKAVEEERLIAQVRVWAADWVVRDWIRRLVTGCFSRGWSRG